MSREGGSLGQNVIEEVWTSFKNFVPACALFKGVFVAVCFV